MSPLGELYSSWTIYWQYLELQTATQKNVSRSIRWSYDLRNARNCTGDISRWFCLLPILNSWRMYRRQLELMENLLHTKLQQILHGNTVHNWLLGAMNTGQANSVFRCSGHTWLPDCFMSTVPATWNFVTHILMVMWHNRHYTLQNAF